MKNQYIGDLGDYGKYSLLRAFVNAGVKVGVNWYLTENDGSTDGKFTDYLKKDELRRYDPVVYDELKKVAFKNTKSVRDIQESGLLGETIFYSEVLSPKGSLADRERERRQWFENSVDTLKDAELIFMDPDNGLMEQQDVSKPGAEKYIMPDEVEEYFKAGHNVVYYCHKGRRKLNDWFKYKSLMFEIIPEAKPVVLTYHKGSQRSYIFVIHEKDFPKYRRILDEFKRRWLKVFSEEYTDYGDVAGAASGESITIEKANGDTVTIEKRADGQLAVSTSRDSNCSIVLSAEMLCRNLGI